MKNKITVIALSFLFSLKTFAQAPNWQWAKSIGGAGMDVGNSIAVDASGNVYTTGSFEGIVDFNPGAGVFNLTSSGLTDMFISKLDAYGNFVWAKAIDGPDYDFGNSIAIDISVGIDQACTSDTEVDRKPCSA